MSTVPGWLWEQCLCFYVRGTLWCVCDELKRSKGVTFFFTAAEHLWNPGYCLCDLKHVLSVEQMGRLICVLAVPYFVSVMFTKQNRKRLKWHRLKSFHFWSSTDSFSSFCWLFDIFCITKTKNQQFFALQYSGFFTDQLSYQSLSDQNVELKDLPHWSGSILEESLTGISNHPWAHWGNSLHDITSGECQHVSVNLSERERERDQQGNMWGIEPGLRADT